MKVGSGSAKVPDDQVGLCISGEVMCCIRIEGMGLPLPSTSDNRRSAIRG